MTEIATLVDRYQKWLRDKTVIKQLHDWTEITTPFLDRHNDHIQIFAKDADGGIILTDDGYILSDLEMSGCSLNTPKRKELLRTTLNGFGVENIDGVLRVKATEDNFPSKKHNLIQSMLAVNDLFFTAQSMVTSLFLEDVLQWLDLLDVRYVPNVKLPGSSGFDHVFDVVIPRSRLQPERLARAISTPNRDKAESFAFAWMDTQKSRLTGSVAYAFVNDNDRHVQTGVKEAFDAYGIRTVYWSRREEVRHEMIA
jgi:hypothetical protein